MRKKAIIFILVFCLLSGGCRNSGGAEKDGETEKPKSTEIKAVWVSYSELDDIIKSSDSAESLKNNIKTVVLNCKSLGLNRIILHTRAFADSYYLSSVFPEADSLSQKIKKDKNFDPLKMFCEICHENEIKTDAWINPYRVSYSNKTDDLPDKSPIKNMLSDKSDDVVVTDDGIYLNPASLGVQKLILDGVREILGNYEVDGIHIDDYFYPETDESFDKQSYENYKNENGKLNLEDWRRENVNNLVSQLYSTVKSYGDDKLFSVSPSGDIEKNYNEFFADVELWCSQKGYADCIIVQAYYGFENDKLPFEQLVGDWEKAADANLIKLCFGLACYKSGSEDIYAGSGINEWKEHNDVISRQISFLKLKEKCSGICLYSYSSLFSDSAAISDDELKNIKNVL